MFMSIASIHHFSHIPHLELDPMSLDLLQKVLPIIMAVFPQLLTLLARSPWSASLSWQRICAPHLLLALLLTLLLILLPILLLILLPMLDFYLVLLRKMLRQHLYIANITRYCWENEAVSDSSWVSTNSWDNLQIVDHLHPAKLTLHGPSIPWNSKAVIFSV